jgi:hypothetical protein
MNRLEKDVHLFNADGRVAWLALVRADQTLPMNRDRIQESHQNRRPMLTSKRPSPRVAIP